MDDDLDILLDEDAIGGLVSGLAERVSQEYAGRDPVLVGVLKAAAPFLADLARALTIPAELAFLEASSYGSGTASSGTVRLMKGLDRDITGRHVLVVDCIVDTGRTLQTLMERLRERHPASVEAVVLLDKSACRKVSVPVRYTGMEAPDRFLVGYGLDKDQQYRNLPYIAAVRS
jgi:hypoxanthine phosphoribosyltransferase